MNEQREISKTIISALYGDKKNLLNVLGLVEERLKLAQENYELWKELINNLDEEE